MAKKQPSNNPAGVGTILSTVAAPSTAALPTAGASPAPNIQNLLAKFAATAKATDPVLFNANKPSEFTSEAAVGQSVDTGKGEGTGSTVTEGNASDKNGRAATLGLNATATPLETARVDSTGQAITTNQGVKVADNQNSLKIGLRGPTALEDFILREKITHFDHERIPERVVHARGSAAHGVFECYESLARITKAAPFAEAGKQTPVFVRFSTVAGERGSADTVRDVRGFAVKFYTEEGNWDLVGNNIPVFFIQDAMKFPDLIHAVKPEPNNQIPQAASAHDTFWDFASLMPESAHMLLWAMSDRAIPRSYRMMQGFGVHTFRLVDAEGNSLFCKFHWQPLAGTHSLVWDEAVKICGADSDFHRRDLWEAIEAGAYPEWELGLQVFTEEQAEAFAFDVLDSTKLVPEELVPVVPVGKMTLNRNPDNFFAETEQVAFCTAHVVPGIDFTNDPLLQGRIHSYLDTQISRLGGVNFHEIPINKPIAPVHNNQRDGMHRQSIARGRVAYEPNSLGGGCPFQAGAMAGFASFPERISDDKVRGKPEKFADHYSQAKLFYQSQSAVEQDHIKNAFIFELTRVQTLAVRKRVVSLLANIDSDLADMVADGLGFETPDAMPHALKMEKPTYDPSPALSLFYRPGDGTIKTRRVAMIVVDGAKAAPWKNAYAALASQGAVPRAIGAKLGSVTFDDGTTVEVETTLGATPSILFDALILPQGEQAIAALLQSGQTMEFLKDQFRHCKPILVGADAGPLLDRAGIPQGEADPGLIEDGAGGLDKFIEALAAHRAYQRETDPPQV